MIGLGNSFGYSINAIMEAIVGGIVSNLDPSVQLEVANVIEDCLKNEAGKINFYQLIYVNPYEFPTYSLETLVKL